MTQQDMALLVVSPASYGVENVINNISPHLHNDGFQISYLTRSEKSVPDKCNKIPLLKDRVTEFTRNKIGLHLIYGVFYFWKLAYSYISKYGDDYDVVWLHNPRLLYLCEKKDNITITYHSHLRNEKAKYHDGLRGMYYYVSGEFEKQGIKKHASERFTSVNSEVRKEIKMIIGNDSRIWTINNGVDTWEYTPETGKCESISWDLPDWDETYLFVGKLASVKRPLATLEVITRLSYIADKDIGLIIAGDGPMRNRIETEIERRGMDNVDFLGFVDSDRMPSLYRIADYFILSSLYDPGGPLALYEAMASGLPSILSEIDQFEFIEKSGCGLRVNFDDIESAAEDILHYTREDVTQDGMRAREYAIKNLGWDSRAESYSQLFRTCL